MARPLPDAGGIVPALDVDSTDALARVVEQTCDVDGVVAYKLGVAGALRLGLARAVQAIRELTELPVIYDHQKAGADIPDMASKFVAICREAGVDGVILFPLAGEDAVRAFVGGALREGLLAAVGGDLPVPGYHASDGGYVADDALERIFRASVDAGATDFVVPASDPATVRRHAGTLSAAVDRPGVFLPGIGALGGSIELAFGAAEGCRPYAVIGRALHASPEPREAAKALAEAALRFGPGRT